MVNWPIALGAKTELEDKHSGKQEIWRLIRVIHTLRNVVYLVMKTNEKDKDTGAILELVTDERSTNGDEREKIIN